MGVFDKWDFVCNNEHIRTSFSLTFGEIMMQRTLLNRLKSLRFSKMHDLTQIFIIPPLKPLALHSNTSSLPADYNFMPKANLLSWLIEPYL